MDNLYSYFKKSIKEILESPPKIPKSEVYIKEGSKTFAELQKEMEGKHPGLFSFPIERPRPPWTNRYAITPLPKKTVATILKQIVEASSRTEI